MPFACGFALGEFLPDAHAAAIPSKRLITSLFLGTALSIASVKIVAMVVREMNFLRRTVGQVILASAIIDDTIGWIIIAIIFGLALHGHVDPLSARQERDRHARLHGVQPDRRPPRSCSLAIRWVNDTFVSEFAGHHRDPGDHGRDGADHAPDRRAHRARRLRRRHPGRRSRRS